MPPSGPRGGQSRAEEDLSNLMFTFAFIITYSQSENIWCASICIGSWSCQPLAREHHLTRGRMLFIKSGELYLYLKCKYREIQKYKWFASICIINWSTSGPRASYWTADCSLRSGVPLVFRTIVYVQKYMHNINKSRILLAA